MSTSRSDTQEIVDLALQVILSPKNTVPREMKLSADHYVSLGTLASRCSRARTNVLKFLTEHPDVEVHNPDFKIVARRATAYTVYRVLIREIDL